MPKPNRSVTFHPPPESGESQRLELISARSPRRWFSLAAAAFAISAALALGLFLRRAPERDARQLGRTVRPRSGFIEKTLRLSGSITALRTASIVAPKLRGTRSRGIGDFSMAVRSLALSGSHVQAGDVLAEFDRQAMEVRLDEFRADVDDRREIIRRVRANLEQNRGALDQRILAAKGAVEKARLNLQTLPVRSAIAAERFRLQFEEAQAHLNELYKQAEYFDVSERSELRRQALRLQLEELEYQRARMNLDHMLLRAPTPGVVVLGQIQRGSEQTEIRDGDELRPGYAFLQVLDTSGLLLEATANQADAQRLRVGARAHVGIDAVPGLTLPAHVISVGTLAAALRYRPDFVRQVPVRVRLEQTDARIYPNSTGFADLVLASESAACIIPRDCVSANSTVRVAGESDDEGWRQAVVLTGVANNVEVVIREGLEGDELLFCGEL